MWARISWVSCLVWQRARECRELYTPTKTMLAPPRSHFPFRSCMLLQTDSGTSPLCSTVERYASFMLLTTELPVYQISKLYFFILTGRNYLQSPHLHFIVMCNLSYNENIFAIILHHYYLSVCILYYCTIKPTIHFVIQKILFHNFTYSLVTLWLKLVCISVF